MFLLGVILGVVSSLLRLIGVPIDSLVGTTFLLFTNNPYIALGYWSTCQGLIMCQTIGELYYTADKDLDDTSCVYTERRKGNMTMHIPALYRFEMFLTSYKIVALLFIAHISTTTDAPGIKLLITGLSFILGAAVIILTIKKLITEYTPLQRIVYLVVAIVMVILFKVLLSFNIGMYNSIPLLLGISFMELPALYPNKEKTYRFHQANRSLEFYGSLDWIDYSYLIIVFFANLGIGTSRLSNFVENDGKNEGYQLLNMYAGKHVGAFTSSMLWILLSSNRSALEESVTNVDSAFLFNSLGIVSFTIIMFSIISYKLMGFFIDLANSPLNDISKTLCSISILFVLISLSLVGTSYNLLFLLTFLLLAIGFNVFVNYIKIPNSALSFITIYVPLTGLLF
jgi:hypothetical protein